MESGEPRLYQTKEFAAKAGVTVRTLHFYDRLGLLKPAARSESGYRLYGEPELERLEQILALRFVGLELEQISKLLEGPPQPLITALRMQRAMMANEQHRLQKAVDAIERAERVLQADPDAGRWAALQNVIEVIRMERDWSWTDNYYTGEDRAKLAEIRKATPQETIEAGQRAWAELIAEVEASVNEDPQGAHAQDLAKRWKHLVQQFTRGDAGISRGLNKLYNDQTDWPKDFKRPWSDAADVFIHAAMSCAG